MKKYMVLLWFICSNIAAMEPTRELFRTGEKPAFTLSPKQQQALEYADLKKNIKKTIQKAEKVAKHIEFLTNQYAIKSYQLMADQGNKNIQSSLQDISIALKEKNDEYARLTQDIKDLKQKFDSLTQYGFARRD